MRSNSFIRCTGFIASWVVFLLLTSRICLADSSNFDFYSWPREKTTNQWCFSLVASSDQALPGVEIKGAKDQICNRHDVKRIMAQMLPVGAKVHWKTDEAAGIVLPPREIVNDLIRFCEMMEYKMILPKGDAQNSRGDRWK